MMETTPIVTRVLPEKPLLGAAPACCILLGVFKVKITHMMLHILEYRVTGAKMAHRQVAFNGTQSRGQPHISQNPNRNHPVHTLLPPTIFTRQPKQAHWHVTAAFRPKHEPLAAVERAGRQVAKTNKAADAQVISCRRGHGLNGGSAVTKTQHFNEFDHSLHHMVRDRETRAKVLKSFVSEPAALSHGTTGLQSYSYVEHGTGNVGVVSRRRASVTRKSLLVQMESLGMTA